MGLLIAVLRRRMGGVAVVAGLILVMLAWAPAAHAGCEFEQGVGQGNFGWDCSGGGSAAPVHRSYGALAATADTGDFWGSSYGYASRAAAESAALARCNKNADAGQHCKIAMWVTNACAALAVAPNGAWGTQWSNSKAVAVSQALKQCVASDDDHSGTCKVVESFCTY